MLRETFIFLPGVGKRGEERFHEKGIADWQRFLHAGKVFGVSASRKLKYDALLREAREAYLAGDASYFAARLPLAEQWRAYEEFKEESLFLDLEIERDGQVSVVCLTDGVETRVLVRGVNLCKEELVRALTGCRMLVTFNGSSFDLPVLRREFGLSWSGLHVDLRTVARRNGFSGGLKDLERTFGVLREYEERYRVALKGGDPALLYRMWRGSGDEYYLRLLLEYNEADAYHLWLLAGRLVGRLEEKFREEMKK